MLQRSSDQLRRGARISLRQLYNLLVIDPHCATKWRECLNKYAICFTERYDIGTGVERVDFNLVNGWNNAWVRGEKFSELSRINYYHPVNVVILIYMTP